MKLWQIIRIFPAGSKTFPLNQLYVRELIRRLELCASYGKNSPPLQGGKPSDNLIRNGCKVKGCLCITVLFLTRFMCMDPDDVLVGHVFSISSKSGNRAGGMTRSACSGPVLWSPDRLAFPQRQKNTVFVRSTCA